RLLRPVSRSHPCYGACPSTRCSLPLHTIFPCLPFLTMPCPCRCYRYHWSSSLERKRSISIAHSFFSSLDFP
ncbi:hypothetical protein BKA56DRAFT_605514, partial [Ilyonectria sp. MPI-CAGE-AT-0026]